MYWVGMNETRIETGPGLEAVRDVSGPKTATGAIRESEDASTPTGGGVEPEAVVGVVGAAEEAGIVVVEAEAADIVVVEVEAADTVVAEVAREPDTVVDVVAAEVGGASGSTQIGSATEHGIVARVAEYRIATEAGIVVRMIGKKKGFLCEFEVAEYSGKEVVVNYGADIGVAAVNSGD